MIAVLVLCFPLKAVSDIDGMIEFSANTMEKIPNREPMSGKLYVAKGKVRIEMVVGGKRGITIRDFSGRKTLHLNPMEKAYVEMPWPKAKSGLPHANIKRPPLPGDPDHPCAKLPQAQIKCRILNRDEKIGNRKTEKWEILQVSPADKKSAETHTIRSLVWVDRKLGVNVREEMFFDANSKRLRELRAIKEGPQPEALFLAPEGYRACRNIKNSAWCSSWQRGMPQSRK